VNWDIAKKSKPRFSVVLAPSSASRFSTTKRSEASQLIPQSDADWVGDRDDDRSVSGTMLLLFGASVVWRASFQKTVALSSTDFEYMALIDCFKKYDWMQLLLKAVRR